MRAGLSAMRVRTGSAADRLARGPGLEAFAEGSHVSFRRGAHRPHSPSGFRLAGPRSRLPRPAGRWRGRRSQPWRMHRQHAPHSVQSRKSGRRQWESPGHTCRSATYYFMSPQVTAPTGLFRDI
ncbi:DUF4157 domain-containing protein [Streptomyces sp. NPDC001027]|uniref:eCIS core domain-containing protein n=1 Tax=Streptomyces sp. NPDC001027 TaxID=3154771 RepID=UPI00332E51F2